MSSQTHDPKPEPLEYERAGTNKVRPGRNWRRAVILGVLAGVLFLLLLAIFTAPVGRAREPANRIKCASNMKQIGIAAIAYANDHGGQFPNDVQTPLKDEDLAPAVFNCPDSYDTPASGPTTQSVLNDFNNPGHQSYVYVGKGLKADAPVDTVILFEPLTLHANDGMNVLFMDGHVAWLSAAEAQSILKQDAAGVRPIRYPQVAVPATEK